MRQETNFDLVRDFHEKFGLAVNETRTAEDLKKAIELRADLIEEEFNEVMDELIGRQRTEGWYVYIDKPKLTKELCDLLYVIYGTGVALGLPLDQAFREVHRSNMSKLGPDGRPIYRGDGKVLKGPDYKEADINQFFGG